MVGAGSPAASRAITAPRSLRHNAPDVSPQPSAARIDALGWALETSPSVVYAADADGRVVFANAAARALTREQYTPSYEAYLTMVHPDDRQRVIDATNRVFHEHVPYSHDERIFRPDGSLRHLHTWAYT